MNDADNDTGPKHVQRQHEPKRRCRVWLLDARGPPLAERSADRVPNVGDQPTTSVLG